MLVAFAMFHTVSKSRALRPQICGDGIVEGHEECDDGNTIAGDGCSWVSPSCMYPCMSVCLCGAPISRTSDSYKYR